MRITIVIPVYNVAHYVEECLISVMRQTYRNLEVIIIDDCGQDESMNIVLELLHGKEEIGLDGISFKIIHHERNRGLSEARNTGLNAATGDYVFFLDSDDTINLNCMEIMSAKARENNVDVVTGRINSWYPEKEDSPVGYFENQNQIRELFFYRKIHPEACGTLVKREIIESNHLRFYSNIVSEDVLWGLQIFCNARTLYCLPDKCYNYRMREGSIMNSSNYDRHLRSFPVILSQSDAYAQKINIAGDSRYQGWLEFYKALFFRNISNRCTEMQLKCYYRDVVRKIHPIPGLNKDRIHYLFPFFIGYHLYQHFYGRYLC